MKEGKDCYRCVWGEKRRHRSYKNGVIVKDEIIYECSQDDRPKPCQRGGWKEKDDNYFAKSQ